MPNQNVIQRLTGIQTILNGVYQSNVSLSSSTKGKERESFVDEFLSKVLPPIYRFGTGDVTDIAGNKSGQLDVVVEYPFSPSLPSVGTGQSRLYLAESVAAVIEVKSDVSTQWNQACHTASQLAPVTRNFGASITMGENPSPEIPLFIVAYTGWNQVATIQKNLSAAPNIAGVLVIDPGVFVSSPQYGDLQATGALALWSLICCLHKITNSLHAVSTKPIDYAVEMPNKSFKFRRR